MLKKKKKQKEHFWADLALVWCLKPQLLAAAVGSDADPTRGLQGGPVAVAEGAEAANEAAPESGCCSGAAI